MHYSTSRTLRENTLEFRSAELLIKWLRFISNFPGFPSFIAFIRPTPPSKSQISKKGELEKNNPIENTTLSLSNSHNLQSFESKNIAPGIR